MNYSERMTDEQKAEILAVEVAKFKDAPTLDALEKTAFELSLNGFYLSTTPGYGDSISELEAAIRDAGIAITAAEGVIQAGAARGKIEREKQIWNLPVSVANRELLSKIRRDSTVEDVRTEICKAIKSGALQPDEINTRKIFGKLRVDDMDRDEASKQLYRDYQRAISEGVAAAAGEYGDNSPEALAIRESATPETVKNIVMERATLETLFIPVADFRRFMNAAKMAESGLVADEITDTGDRIAAEVEAVRENPTFAQLERSALAVAVRGSNISVDVLEMLIAAMKGAN